MPMQPPKRSALYRTAFVLSLILFSAFNSQAQQTQPTPKPTPAQTPTPAPAPSCGAPQVIKMIVYYKKGDQPWEKKDENTATRLARKRFYISTKPFNLEKIPDLGRAPSRKSYYASVHASSQLIKWLEDNNCDTVYCRELRSEEVTCKTTDANCVPEFVAAYEKAQRELKNGELARKWITNYAPLSSPEFSSGFYDKRSAWLNGAVQKVERASSLPAGTIKSTMTDRQGVAYFYDLCPGTEYYISSVAPIDVGSEGLLWETVAKKLKKETESTVSSPPLTFINVPPADASKVNKTYFVAKKVTESASTIRPSEAKPAGQ
jgi:hypothetical protein